MSFARIFIILVVGLFGFIGYKAYAKKQAGKSVEIMQLQTSELQKPVTKDGGQSYLLKHDPSKAIQTAKKVQEDDQDEKIDRVWQLFTTVAKDRLPIVETISYSARAPWIKGRPAWIADYASHYMTSRHFIARSLNGKVDYFTQKVSPGDRFNVLRTDKNINFYLLVDISRLKMWFYYLDLDQNEKVLLKTYKVGAGRLDEKGESLTPTGKYMLGDKIAIYKPGTIGHFQNQPIEMIQVFGTRWLPFKEEIGDCAKPARGYGIHGAPCFLDSESNDLKEMTDSIGHFDSDGCVRLLKDDVEELFSIVITRPTIVEIVKDSSNLRQEKIEALKVTHQEIE
jgi:lipoprotein-anchoring transpeptidase ErfK/SrfK